MPVRSLSSRVLVWPSRARVEKALREWAVLQAASRPELLRVGLFGSYARGDWGVGSDLDLVLIVRTCSQPWERRAASWDTLSLPVSVDAVVYTPEEWDELVQRRSSLPQTVSRDIVWVFERGR